MNGPRIGSLFSGTGQLDEAVKAVFGGAVVFHSQYEPPDKNGKEDPHQYAAKILARHYPDVPNLGDITAIDWPAVIEEHGQIDILTGGFPCQDISSAGKRAGLTADSRSGLWTHMARAIHELQPRLVVIENVQGLLSTKADRGLGSDAEALEEEAEAGRILRALGAVLGDLATLRLDAEWCRLGASEVGAPHSRKRIVIYAWPATTDPADLGHQRRRDARRRGHGPADSGVAAADAIGIVPGHDGELQAGRDALQRGLRADAPRCGEAPTNTAGQRYGHTRPAGERRIPAAAVASRAAAPADTPGDGRGEGRPESAREQGRSDAAECGLAATPDADGFRRRAEVLDLRPGQPDLDWGDYGPAVRRWEHVLGRPAPWPTDALGRLSPVFTEWHMGYPDGWVTCTPGLTRNAMLRALGNGVVPQQMEAGIRLLHARAQQPLATAA